jgi:hypothetical protein
VLRENLRDLRHRVQDTRASDLDVYWPYVMGEIDRLVRHRLPDWEELYGRGLSGYLGLAG